jgi:hypothetical protein
VVRYGDGPATDVHVTIYRRPLDEGDGYKALFVVMNESDRPVQLPLRLLDPERVLGGPNTLTAGDVRKPMSVLGEGDTWWPKLAERDAGQVVLMDLETRHVVARAEGSAEVYGPLHVPYHDYRVLYGHCEK